jgi:hypothetical protein
MSSTSEIGFLTAFLIIAGSGEMPLRIKNVKKCDEACLKKTSEKPVQD